MPKMADQNQRTPFCPRPSCRSPRIESASGASVNQLSTARMSLLEDRLEAIPQAEQGPSRGLEGLYSGFRQGVTTLRPASPLGGRIRQRRFQQPLLLEAIE